MLILVFSIMQFKCWSREVFQWRFSQIRQRNHLVNALMDIWNNILRPQQCMHSIIECVQCLHSIIECVQCMHSIIECVQCMHSIIECVQCMHSIIECVQCLHSITECIQCMHSIIECVQCMHSIIECVQFMHSLQGKNIHWYSRLFHHRNAKRSHGKIKIKSPWKSP